MARTTVLRASRLIDGTGAPPVTDGVVVMTAGRIVAAGAASAVTVPADADVETHEYPDCTLLPGFIDCHTHLVFSAQDSALQDAIGDADETLVLRALANAQAELKCGVTTLRDCGGRGFLTLRVRDAINRGLVAGPRILASAMPITTTGGHLNFCGLEADGTHEVVKAVRTLCKGGVDFIKVMATGGGMTPGTNPRAPQFTLEELTALVTDARRLGRHVAAHCHATAGIANAVDAGVRTIEHCSWLGPVDGHEFVPRVVERMVEKGTYVSLTMGSERAALKPHSQLSDAQIRGVAHYGPHFDVLRRTVQGGVKFVASSDAGVARTFFDEYPMTLEVMVAKLDISPMEALRSTTGRAAEALEIAADHGTLEPGKRGDVVLVQGDPLADIRALRSQPAVYRDGQRVVVGGILTG